ncbi:MAG TPA: CoA transferase [Candidatus Binataceae bacterium]|nr:CoA transferase [Candidatus Binataceae bacterium]
MLEQKPLKGIRVLDVSRVLAGPYCTMNLADLGAEVIKIELPGHGDDARRFPPMIPNANDSAYFYGINRGKMSVTLDLRSAEGAAVFLELAALSDVVVENFSPGTMARFGLGYEQLCARNPRLILCSISGFGQSGPMASLPAYDIVAQAMGGTMSVTGMPGGEPTRCGLSIGDMVAALYATVAILAALRVRDQRGTGQHLDIAMLDCQVAMLEGALGQFSATGTIPGRIGSRHPSITPFQQFPAADDYFVVGAGNEALWQRFCDAVGLAHLKADPRFVDNAGRTRNHAQLDPLLREHFITEPRSHWLKLLGDAGVPCAPVSNVAEVARNPQLLERNMILGAEHPTYDGLLVPGSPLKSAGHDSPPSTRAPALGEHTDSVLQDLLGYDRARMAELRARGII